MELNKNQRGALIIELEKARDDFELANRILESDTAKADDYIQDATDMQRYLAMARMETIKQALTDNEIDY